MSKSDPQVPLSGPPSSPSDAAVRRWSDVLRSYYAFAGCLLCCAPLLSVYIVNLLQFEHYQFVMLAIPGFVFLVWNSRAAERTPCIIPHWWDRSLMVGGGVLLGLAVAQWNDLLAAIAAFLICGAILVGLRRTGIINRCLTTWLFLLLLLRPPGDLDLKLMRLTQDLSLSLASFVLEFADVLHVRLGNIIWARGEHFLVNEAFRGTPFILSLMALTAFGLILFDRPRFHSIVLLVSAAFWTLATNVTWIVAIVLGSLYWDLNLTQGTFGWLTDWSLFLFAATMQACTGLAMACYPSRVRSVRWFGPSEADEEYVRAAGRTTSESLFAGITLAVFACLFLGQCGKLVAGAQSSPHNHVFAQADLPDSLNDWVLSEFSSNTRSIEDFRGQNNASWTFQQGDSRLHVAVDYPFSGWHHLTHCYAIKGDVAGAEAVEQNDQFPQQVVRTDLTTADGAPGILVYTLFGPDGNCQPPVEYGFRSVADEVFHGIRQGHSPETQYYQVQLLYSGQEALDATVRQELTELHMDISNRVLSVIQSPTDRSPQ